MKHLLTLEQLSPTEINEIITLASEYKQELKKGIPHKKNLNGKTLGMIFEKSSSRTRVSFEVGMYQLGGYALFLSSRDTQLGRGESIKDSARVFGRYLDGIMIRTFKQSDVEDLAKYSGISIINGLTDYCHPCQVLADLMTIREHKGSFDGLKVCYIGDGNNMANSIIVGALKTGMRVSVATPKGYEPHKHIIEFANSFDGMFELTHDTVSAAKNADVIFTDVWSSMGMEDEAELRKKAFKSFCVNKELLDVANPECMVQHCLPAHKGEEITEEIFEKHAGEIFDEAENRLHAQKAVLYLTMKD